MCENTLYAINKSVHKKVVLCIIIVLSIRIANLITEVLIFQLDDQVEYL